MGRIIGRICFKGGSNHRIGGRAVGGRDSQRRRAHRRRRAKANGRIVRRPAKPNELSERQVKKRTVELDGWNQKPGRPSCKAAAVVEPTSEGGVCSNQQQYDSDERRRDYFKYDRCMDDQAVLTGHNWTPLEDRQIMNKRRGTTDKMLAAKLRRTISAIRTRRQTLKKMPAV